MIKLKVKLTDQGFRLVTDKDRELLKQYCNEWQNKDGMITLEIAGEHKSISLDTEGIYTKESFLLTSD